MTKRKALPLAAMMALAVFLCGCEAKEPYSRQQEPSVRPISVQSGGSIADIAEAISPCVVGIRTRTPDITGDVQEGIGSGVIVTEDGYILTNHHVAGQAWQVSVIFHDGTQAEGRTVWAHAALDLAVVKIEGVFPYAPMGDSTNVRVGDPVIAIGTPLTLQFQHTVTSGIISAKHRTLQVSTSEGGSFMEDLLQTDAPINPGNSGGPLLDLSGNIIGINTLKISQAEGIGFALPIEVAAPIIGHFVRDGEYMTPYLGVFAYDSEIARFYDDKMEGAQGLYVINVDEKGPGGLAGLAVGDVLLRADERELSTMLDLRIATYSHTVGEKMEVTYRRGGQIRTIEVWLARSPLEIPAS